MFNSFLGISSKTDNLSNIIGSILKGVTNPAVKGPVASAARLVFSPTGVLTGLYYANGKFFNKDRNRCE